MKYNSQGNNKSEYKMEIKENETNIKMKSNEIISQNEINIQFRMKFYFN